jgi:hypothetical protein
MNSRILLLAIGIAVSITATHAHHSIAGAYDTTQQVTLEGVVAQFHFVNPHPYLTVDVASPGGVQQWRFEMDNRGELSRAGMAVDTLKQGDRVVVSGNPSRTIPQGLYIRRLDRPSDGFRYEQVGSSPRIARIVRR